VAVAGGQVRAGLCDADDRLAALQFLSGDAEIGVALDIERGHCRIVRIIEPPAAAQAWCLVFVMFRHGSAP
jgi:hypothetical protein